MPTHARVEIKPSETGHRLIVDGVDITNMVSANNFRIEWDRGGPTVHLQLLNPAKLTADLPDAILHLVNGPSEPDTAETQSPAGGEFMQFLSEMRRDLDIVMRRADGHADPLEGSSR